jgi:hypothetical protein
MALTSRPLDVLVHPSLWDAKPVEELRAKGNNVESMLDDDITGVALFDLILGPNCWRILSSSAEDAMIALAIKAARRQKYGRKADEYQE